MEFTDIEKGILTYKLIIFREPICGTEVKEFTFEKRKNPKQLFYSFLLYLLLYDFSCSSFFFSSYTISFRGIKEIKGARFFNQLSYGEVSQTELKYISGE